LQKWNEDPEAGPLCPRADDYPIFFATSERAGKDNSGEYVYLKDANGDELLDLYGHMIVDTDLYDPKTVLSNQLENLLQRDAADPTASQAHRARYESLLPLLPQRPTIAEAFVEFAQAQGFSLWREG